MATGSGFSSEWEGLPTPPTRNSNAACASENRSWGRRPRQRSRNCGNGAGKSDGCTSAASQNVKLGNMRRKRASGSGLLFGHMAATSTAPSENRSLRGSGEPPSSSSGAAKNGVPPTPRPPRRTARPKSSSLSSPRSVRIRLAGLISRCSTPRRCTNASASSACCAIFTADGASIGIDSESTAPCTYSRTRNTRPSAIWPTSRTDGIAGCCSDISIDASAAGASSSSTLQIESLLLRRSRTSAVQPSPPWNVCTTSNRPANAAAGNSRGVAGVIERSRSRRPTRCIDAPRGGFASRSMRCAWSSCGPCP